MGADRLFTLCFHHDSEARAFVERLTGFLDSSSGRRYRAHPERLEAWEHVNELSSTWRACVYVSTVAFVAAQAAGLDVTLTDGIAREDLPKESRRVL